MGGEPGGRFGVRGTAENIETQVVTHDSRQQPCVRAGAVERLVLGVERGRLNRWPWWLPQRVDAGRLVDDRRDVAAFFEQRHVQEIVLEHPCPATLIDGN